MSLIVINCNSVVHANDYNFTLYYNITYNIANKCLKYIISLNIFIYYNIQLFGLPNHSQQVKSLKATLPLVTIYIYTN